MGVFRIEPVILLKNIVLLLHLKTLLKLSPSLRLVANTVVFIGPVYNLRQIVLVPKVLIKPIIHDHVETKLQLLLPERFPLAFLLHGLLLQLCLLFFCHLHLLDLRAFLDFDPLELNGISFVLHFGYRKPHVEVLLKLLRYVSEAQFYHLLTELGLLLGLFDSLGVEDEVVNLDRLSLLVSILSYISKTQRDSDTHLTGAILLSFFFWDRLLTDALHYIVRSDVNEHFSTCLIE